VIQAAQAEHKERDEDNPVIIAEAESPVHEMSVSDAVMQMDLSDRPFVMFRNASHGEINMVYRRDDGNIGWIDPAVSLRSSLAPSAAKKRSGVTARNKSSAQSKAKKARKRG
jgi:hypothetical protein